MIRKRFGPILKEEGKPFSYSDDIEDKAFTNWHELLILKVKQNGENELTLIFYPDKDALTKDKFQVGYGGIYETAFSVWGENFVYFPQIYDGYPSIGCVPRNPCKIAFTIEDD